MPYLSIEADPDSSSGKWENSSESLPISPLNLEEDSDEEQKVLVSVEQWPIPSWERWVPY